MLVLMLPGVSSRVSGFPVASPCLWGKLQNLSFSKVSKQVVRLFCVAGAALCDITTYYNLFDNMSKIVLCGKRSTFASFSQNDLQFSWQAQHVGDLCRYFAWQAQHSTLHPLHFTLHTPYSTIYTLHFILYTPHFTLCILHSSLHTLHSTLYTLQFTHSTLHTLHSTLLTLHSTLYTPHSTLYTFHSTPQTPHFTLHTLHFTLYTLHSTLHTPHSTLYTWHLTLDTPHFTLHTVHTLHSRLYTPQSTLSTPPSCIFHSQKKTVSENTYGNRGNMYKTIQINCFRKVFCLTAYPCVSASVPLTYVWAFGFVGCILLCICWYYVGLR